VILNRRKQSKWRRQSLRSLCCLLLQKTPVSWASTLALQPGRGDIVHQIGKQAFDVQ
jgi:hypothetical protein